MTRARDVANLIGSGNYSSTTFTATAGQTAFTISHTQGFVQVFMNGLLLDETVDYTSNGSAVTLTSGAAAGDEIEVVAYNTFSVGDALNTSAADTRYVNASGDTMTGNLGIGAAPSFSTLEVTADKTAANNLQLTLRGSTNTNKQMIMGFDTTDDKSFITSQIAGSAQKPLIINASSVGIGTSSPSLGSNASGLHIKGASGDYGVLKVDSSTTSEEGWVQFSNNGVDKFRIASDSSTNLKFIQSGVAERMRIDGGNVLVGTTSAAFNNDAKIVLVPNSDSLFINNGQCLSLNRTSTDGTIIGFYKDASGVGGIGNIGTGIYIAAPTNGGAALLFSDNANVIYPSKNNSGTVAVVDDYVDLGASALRFDDVFATNGTIQTSDENEKQDIASLTSAEITAATAISKLFKTFKWKDKVAAKGDNARTHTGVVAQQVQTAMSDAGLDASKYAFWCSDTWWTKDVEVAAVEADEEKDIEAKDAYTRTDYYYTADEAPEGATEHTRMGIRYPELLAFVGAATEQRLTSIESRLTALEGG